MRIGIIGLPGSGKTTVFNALTRGKAQAGGYSAGRGANVGVAHVPDQRLGVLAKMYRPKKVVHGEVVYVDLPGGGAPSTARDASGPVSELFTGEAVTQLQKVDALLLVVRAFEDGSVLHILGSVDWRRDIEKIGFDLLFADIALIDRRIQRLNDGMKGLKVADRDQAHKAVETLRRVQADLESGSPLRAMQLSESEERALQNTFLLSGLPLLVAVNIGEQDLARAGEIERDAAALLKGPKTGAAAICAKLETELARLPAGEEAEMRAGLGAGESGLSRMIGLSYRVLGLISFLTVGEDEVRAWTVPAGSVATKAAGRVHSDIERGFIRAEVVSYDDLADSGSLAESRKRGHLRQEGREYLVKDGDVVNFLFSV